MGRLFFSILFYGRTLGALACGIVADWLLVCVVLFCWHKHTHKRERLTLHSDLGPQSSSPVFVGRSSVYILRCFKHRLWFHFEIISRVIARLIMFWKPSVDCTNEPNWEYLEREKRHYIISWIEIPHQWGKVKSNFCHFFFRSPLRRKMSYGPTSGPVPRWVGPFLFACLASYVRVGARWGHPLFARVSNRWVKTPSRLPPSPQFSCFFLATFGRGKGTGSEAPHPPDGGTDESIFLTEMFSMSRVWFSFFFKSPARQKYVYNSISKERKPQKRGSSEFNISSANF